MAKKPAGQRANSAPDSGQFYISGAVSRTAAFAGMLVALEIGRGESMKLTSGRGVSGLASRGWVGIRAGSDAGRVPGSNTTRAGSFACCCRGADSRTQSHARPAWAGVCCGEGTRRRHGSAGERGR